MFLFCDNNPNVIRIIIFQNIKKRFNILLFSNLYIFSFIKIIRVNILQNECKLHLHYNQEAND